MANDTVLSTELIRLHLAMNHGVAIGFDVTPGFSKLAFRKYAEESSSTTTTAATWPSIRAT